MDPNYCGKHEYGFFDQECPICERDRLRAELKRIKDREEHLEAERRYLMSID